MTCLWRLCADFVAASLAREAAVPPVALLVAAGSASEAPLSIDRRVRGAAGACAVAAGAAWLEGADTHVLAVGCWRRGAAFAGRADEGLGSLIAAAMALRAPSPAAEAPRAGLVPGRWHAGGSAAGTCGDAARPGASADAARTLCAVVSTGTAVAASGEAGRGFENVLDSACGKCAPEYACVTSEGIVKLAETLLEDAPDLVGDAAALPNVGDVDALLAREAPWRGKVALVAACCVLAPRGDRSELGAVLLPCADAAGSALTASFEARAVFARGVIAGDTSWESSSAMLVSRGTLEPALASASADWGRACAAHEVDGPAAAWLMRTLPAARCARSRMVPVVAGRCAGLPAAAASASLLRWLAAVVLPARLPGCAGAAGGAVLRDRLGRGWAAPGPERCALLRLAGLPAAARLPDAAVATRAAAAGTA